MTFVTRFAPSPTGPLHLGHAYSAMLAFDMAQRAQGRFLLRIEDIDLSRARPEWEAQIYEDLHWLGLHWETPVLRQSDNMRKYEEAIEYLWDSGFLYPCTCNRRDILAAASAPQEGSEPAVGPDGIIYPGTCRPETDVIGDIPKDAALRLNMRKVVQESKITHWCFNENLQGPKGQSGLITASGTDLTDDIGDVVIARRDMGTSYHLSVVVDDATQAITDVVRGQDLFDATMIHIVLQRLLGLSSPVYHHHGLIRDEYGKRLAKRCDARAIAKYRTDGLFASDLRALVGLQA